MPERRSYQTKQQDAVSAFFRHDEGRCLTAEEVYAELCREGAELGKTTVYRAITRLCKAGLLRKYAPVENGGAARYQYNPCEESHLHIRCVNCGELAHLCCEEVRQFAGHLAAHHGFTLDEGQTILYGRCEQCAHISQREETP